MDYYYSILEQYIPTPKPSCSLTYVYKNVPLTSIMAHVKDMSQLMSSYASKTADFPSPVPCDSNRMSIRTHGAEKSYPRYATKLNTPVGQHETIYHLFYFHSTQNEYRYDGSTMISAAACGANVYNHHELLFIY